jgi:two-component sensor histidine kinase
VPSTRRPTSWARVHAARDITDRKRPEETQRLLLCDLNHRVKNTLTNAQAIAQQKMLRWTKDPAEFAASFSGRIQSLLRLQHALSSATWKGVDSHAWFATS